MARSRDRTRVTVLIAVFRLAKAVFLVAAAVGVLQLVHPRAGLRIDAWLGTLPFLESHPQLRVAAAKVTHASPHRLEVAASIALAYAALFATEGIGLWQGRVWAEYLTIVATTSFIPFEVYELVRRATPVRAAALAVNATIVAYLLARRLRARRRR